MMRSAASTQTVKLATARLEFSRDRRIREALQLAVVTTLFAVLAIVARPFIGDDESPAARLAAMQQQNASLRADLARVRMELALEHSTRTSLERQVVELNRNQNELKSRLEFFTEQSGHADGRR